MRGPVLLLFAHRAGGSPAFHPPRAAAPCNCRNRRARGAGDNAAPARWSEMQPDNNGGASTLAKKGPSKGITQLTSSTSLGSQPGRES